MSNAVGINPETGVAFLRCDYQRPARVVSRFPGLLNGFVFRRLVNEGRAEKLVQVLEVRLDRSHRRFKCRWKG
jgi:hypothetical protein